MNFLKEKLGIIDLEEKIRLLERRVENHEDDLKKMSEVIKLQSFSIASLSSALKRLVYSIRDAKMEEMIKESIEKDSENYH